MKDFYNQSKSKIFEELKTSDKGLSSMEAKNRLEKNGKNRFKQAKKKNFFVKFISQFKNFLIAILLVSALVSVVVAIIDNDYTEYINAGIILFVIILNACIGVFQESKADKSMQKLKNITEPETTVLRNGKRVRIKTEEIVVGDIVMLEAGDSVPADLRIIESNSLKIVESALTGESIAVEKDSKIIKGEVALGDQCNMAFMGTTVVYGRGQGVVVRTGMQTEIGKIADLLHQTKAEKTPLTKKVDKTSTYIGVAVFAVALFILVYGVLVGDDLSTSLILAVAIAVCAVPEGLPACITIVMSMGVNEMSKKKAIVKNLSSVETLGSTQVICSDKTGTLTLNKMVVKDLFTFDSKFEESFSQGNEKENIRTLLIERKNILELMKCMILCNDSQVKIEGEKTYTFGDPTEVALTEYGLKQGVIKEEYEKVFERINEIPFDSNRKLMTTINSVGDKSYSYTKGAVDNLLAKCSKVFIDGKVLKITEELKRKILEKNAEFGGRALRVLGFAFKPFNKDKCGVVDCEEDMVFLGLVGMIDPPREEVYDAIKTCKSAGIRAIMITGDHKATAYAIAKDLEIATDEKEVITGKELDELSEEDFNRLVNFYSVYARVNPEHKVRIVEALKSQGNIVAMTGDGVNDAPSIKRADIGVGMGVTGTDVTKDAADIILTDDNFATIVGAVKEGRRIYDNILKVIQFLMGTSLAELFILTVITTFLRESFFTPILILWFNLISDSLVALALGVEPAEKDIMSRKPTKGSGSLFKGRVGLNLLYASVCVSCFVFSVFCVGKFALGLDPAQVTTMCYITLVIGELLHAFNLKSDKYSIFNKRLFKNKWLNISFIISVFLSIIILLIPIPSFQVWFGIANISPIAWIISIAFAGLIVPFMEIQKLILRKIDRKKKIT